MIAAARRVPGRGSRATLVALTVLLSACAAATAPSTEPSPPIQTAASTSDASLAPSLVAPSPSPAGSTTPPELSGTWRTTLAGQTVVLILTPSTYRIIRGVNQATGEVTVDGDRIDFFNSSLCPGTGEYRWTIDGDSLRFSSLAEPCPGRAEALLNVRYGDYSPPD